MTVVRVHCVGSTDDFRLRPRSCLNFRRSPDSETILGWHGLPRIKKPQVISPQALNSRETMYHV